MDPSTICDSVGQQHLAAFEGHLCILKEIVEQMDDTGKGAVSSIRDGGFGGTLLHAAVEHQRIAVCKYLLEELHLDINMADYRGRTPLNFAIHHESVDAAKYLLDHGADPSTPDVDGHTPLHNAALIGSVELVQHLLSEGVLVDPVSASATPLFLASVYGHHEVVKMLLDHGAQQYKFVAPSPYNALFFAIHGFTRKWVKLLVEAGADVNAASEQLVTPLVSAGFTACIEYLLQKGANPNIPDQFGKMPMEIAAIWGRRKDVEILFPSTSPISAVPGVWSVDSV